jgi:cytochrome c oxidase subunit 1
MVAGYSGQQRRLYDPYQYTYLQHLHGLNKATSHAAFALGISQILFIINFFQSLFAGKKAEKNPWKIGTLEWELPSPPPYHNFDVVPTVVRGPHEYANPEANKLLGRDWLTQTEVLPEASAAGEEDTGEAAAGA